MALDALHLGYCNPNAKSWESVSARKLYFLFAQPDLTEVRKARFEELWSNGGNIKDLSPLRGLPITALTLYSDLISDLQPLADMPKLKNLRMDDITRVKDLSPLRAVKTLRSLVLGASRVIDLAPLEGLPLDHLGLTAAVTDLSPLRKVPLKSVHLGFQPFRGDTGVLRAIPTLGTINNVSAREFLKKADDEQAAFDKWCRGVAKLPAKEQVAAVEKELQGRNPGMTVRVQHETKNDQVIELRLQVANMTDLAPVRALASLQRLSVSEIKKAKLVNLWPLKGLSLEALVLGSTAVTDLTPLQDMTTLTSLDLTFGIVADLAPLRRLSLKRLLCGGNQPLRDLSPLQGMKLGTLACFATGVSDLSPLRGMPLTELWVNSTPVSDLAPVRGMALTTLVAHLTKVSDYSAVKEMPLTKLYLDFVPWRDSALVRSLPTLKQINDKPAAMFHAWADWEDAVRAAPADKQVEMIKAKLIEVNGKAPGIGLTAQVDREKKIVTHLQLSGPVKDIAPVRAAPHLEALYAGGIAGLADLGPLRGLKLKRLLIDRSAVKDLTPLAGMPLEHLNVRVAPVSDLSPLRGMPLKDLDCGGCQITTFEPLSALKLERLVADKLGKLTHLKGLEQHPLVELHLTGSPVADLSPLKKLPLQRLRLEIEPFRGDADLLRAIPSLKTINDVAAEEFLYKAGEKRAAFDKWCAGVAKLSPKEQAEAVRQKLKEINPGLNAAGLTYQATDKAVVIGTIPTSGVTDISPVRALPALRALYCPGDANSKLANLWPLQGLGVATLGIPRLPITDLSPLKGLKLTSLDCSGTKVHDLSPLAGMPLDHLDIRGAPITDLSLLAGLPLVTLYCDYQPQRDRKVLQGITTLRTINGKPAAEVLKAGSK
jgi:Leucine-rich repeat (LRR) protein